MACTKRCFESVPALRRLEPQVLRDLLACFPEHAKGRGIDLPETANEGNLNYRTIRDALMEGEVPDELDDVLYLASQLGDARGWDVIQRQAHEDRRTLRRPPARLGHADLAILAEIEDWPRHKGFLERANARARVHSRSSYFYYAPRADPRSLYRGPTKSGVEAARDALTDYLVEQGVLEDTAHGRGVEVIPYDFEKEVWFLIRHPGRRKRHSGCDPHGDWRSYVFNPEEYDAVAYNKVFADIRMNTRRIRDHRKYRMVFGDLLFGGASNVFRPKEQLVSLAPAEGARAAELFGCGDVPELGRIAPVELVYERGGVPARRHTETALDGGTLLDRNPHQPGLLPEGGYGVRSMVLTYKLRGKARDGKITLQTGNRVNYERDGDSLVIEDWLRKRKFVKSFVEA